VDEESRTATAMLDGLPVHLELSGERLLVRVGDEAVPRYDVPLHRVTDVHDQTGLLNGAITVTIGEDRLSFLRVPKAQVRPMAEALRALAATATHSADDEPPAADQSPLADLERLGRLLESGVLTQAEFDEAKRKLLDRL
jgi:hypothetical protein